MNRQKDTGPMKTKLSILVTLAILGGVAIAFSSKTEASDQADWTKRTDKYELSETFARRGLGKSIRLFDEDVLLGAAWMEPTTALENDPRVIFDDEESIDLFLGMLGADSGGDVRVKIKVTGDVVGGKFKEKFRDFIDDDDVVLSTWFTLGVLPRGRYRLKLSVRDGTVFGRGAAEIYFEVLDVE